MSVFLLPPTTGAGVPPAAQSVLRLLLENRIASGVLVDIEATGKEIPHRRLVHDVVQLAHSLPLAPVIQANGARLAAQLTDRRFSPDGAQPDVRPRVAVVMRPCEAKATIELSKLRQVDLSQVMIVAVDCVGTYEAAAWKDFAHKTQDGLGSSLAALRAGEAESPQPMAYRQACTRCVDPVAPVADIWLHVIGVSEQAGLLIEVRDPELAEDLGLPTTEDAPGRVQALDRLTATRAARRRADIDGALQALRPGVDGTPGLAAVFDSCLRCLNCGTACPICYCKECLFRTDSVRVECRHLKELAERRGAVRLPGDAILYQLTRLMHVSTSCVGCGLCSSACPMDLPVDLVFQSVGRETQALLAYRPGFDLESPIPSSTFVRDEFVDLGEH
jgi:formate dehydrogenase (coenzyme F420) beta subunit